MQLTLRINTSTEGDFTLYGPSGPGLPLCPRTSFPDFDYTALEMGMVLQRSLLGGFGVHHGTIFIYFLGGDSDLDDDTVIINPPLTHKYSA